MSLHFRSCMLAALFVAPSCALAADAPRASVPASIEERFVVVSGGEKVGHVIVLTRGSQRDIDYVVDDNGRGPRQRETMHLDSQGLPIDWRIQGRSEMGAVVTERFGYRSGLARWRTLNDAGSSRSPTTPLYVASDASPWSRGLYARALLNAPGRRLPALPSGELRLEALRDVDVGSGATAKRVSAWVLWGVGALPEFLLLEPDGRLFARLGAFGTTVAESHAGEGPALMRLLPVLSGEYLQKITATLRHAYDASIYIRNARVFDSVGGTVTDPLTVVVFRSRIVGLHAAAPPPDAAIVIDAEGGTLVPGLFDMHAHLTSGWSGLLHIAGGVTSVRDAGNDNTALRALTDSIDSARVIGPRVTPMGFIEGRSPFSVRNGFVVERLAEALQSVRWYADHGYRGIKIYNSMTPDWVRPLADEAHRLGLTVMGHVPAFMSSERAIRDGYDEVTHINQLLLSLVIDPLRDDTRTTFRFTALGERLGTLDLRGEAMRGLIAQMKERRVAVDPTVAIFQQILLSRPGAVAPNDAPWLANMPAAFQRQRMKSQVDIKPEQAAAYRASWAKLLAAIKLLHDEGIRILAGTDNIAGFMLHSELEAYALAGIAPAEVLQIGTIEAARHLGQEHSVGSIEVGKLADFLLVPGDPTRDLGLIRKARMVFKNGDVYFPAEIHAAMSIKPFSTRPPIVVRGSAAAAQNLARGVEPGQAGDTTTRMGAGTAKE